MGSSPILVVSDDVEIFRTIEDAEKHLEPPDVGRIKVFDSDGRPVKVALGKRLLSEVVRLEVDPASPPQVGELRSNLIRLISGRTEIADDLNALSLDELWERSTPFFIT
jgi:hypothetical protein